MTSWRNAIPSAENRARIASQSEKGSDPECTGWRVMREEGMEVSPYYLGIFENDFFI